MQFLFIEPAVMYRIEYLLRQKSMLCRFYFAGFTDKLNKQSRPTHYQGRIQKAAIKTAIE